MAEIVVEPERVTTFEDFFEAQYERLLRAMYLSTGDRHEAEDLAQDAMARMYERWDRVREAEDPVGYVFRTALNLRRSRLRRLATATKRGFRSGPETTEPMSAADERDAIRRALGKLPTNQRDALILCDWLGMTDAEAGATLRISPGAVRVRLHRARSAVRPLLRGDTDE